MTRYKLSLAFAKLPDADVAAFALNVVEKMNDNPGFPTPLVPLSELTNARATFQNGLALAMGGGLLATATKNAARLTLINLLRQQAAYVQSLAGADLPLLLSSGFSAASTNRAQLPLPQAVIKSVKTPQGTVISLAVEPVQSARGYEARYKTESGDYVPANFSTSSRGILLKDLVPGVVYTIQARALGGLNGCGDWSDAVSRMAI